MGKAKKKEVSYKEKVYYFANLGNCLGPGDEIFVDDTQEESIKYLQQEWGEDIEVAYIYEVKCIGKYKINVQLEKID